MFEAKVGWDRLRSVLDPTGPLWREASDFDFTAHAPRGGAFERLAALRGPLEGPDVKRVPQAADSALDLMAVVRAANRDDAQVPALTDQFVRVHQALVAAKDPDGTRSAFEQIE